jgi:FAD/FMN-containing dehydrogenase
MIDRFAACPSPMTGIVIEHFHGAVTRIDVTDTAVPHREPGYNSLIASVWMDPAATGQNITWTRATYTDLEPYLARRRYVNYLGDDEPTGAVQSAYGPNFARLVEIKRRYDPGNLFRLNQNIEP